MARSQPDMERLGQEEGELHNLFDSISWWWLSERKLLSKNGKVLTASLEYLRIKYRKDFASAINASLRAMLDCDRPANAFFVAVIRVYDDVSVSVTYLNRLSCDLTLCQHFSRLSGAYLKRPEMGRESVAPS